MSELDLARNDDGIVDLNLPLSRLLLDEENFRIDEVDNQIDAIYAILRQQGEGKKIYNLAKHIVERGRLAPGDRLMVIQDDGQVSQAQDDEPFYVVMEGNRRVTALKLLDNPLIIQESFPKLYQQFASLSKQAPQHLLANLPCVVLPDRESAMDWVEIKHSTNLDGIGLEKWDATATARFAERRGRFRRWRIVIRRLQAAGRDTASIEAGIIKKTTAVDRVLGAREVRDSLGLIFKENPGTVEFENGDETSGLNLLQAMMERMSANKFSTAEVHGLDARVDFILEFQELAVRATQPSVPAESDGGGQANNVGAEQAPAGNGSKEAETKEDNLDGASEGQPTRRSTGPRNSKSVGKHPLRRQQDRKTLAPKSRDQTFHVKDPALNDLYGEIREIPVKSFPKAAGVLTRVFLEMSCDSYLEHRNLPLPDFFAKRSVKRWPDAKLREKVQAVLGDLDPKGQNSALEPVRKALGGNDWLHSIDTLHEFVHNRLASITEQEVKTIWDRYQPFFASLHGRIIGE